MNRSRKVVTMLLSLLAAVLLWLYVVTVVAPEATTRVSGIPINIDGSIVLEERGLLITAQDVSSLALELSASRVNLTKLNAETIRINADASRIREPGTYALTCTVTFPDTVRSSDVDILRKSVDSVTVTVARLEKKSIPIELDWTGTVKEGFLFERGNVVMEPSEVVVTGPAEELEQIDSAIVHYNVSDLEETTLLNLPISFYNREGGELEFSEWSSANVTETIVTLPVFRTRELSLALELIESVGISKENAQVTLEPESIHVKGQADVIDALEDPYVLGSVNLAAVAELEERSFSLNLPAGVTNVSGEEEVRAVISLTGVESETISVSDIRLTNTPAGYKTELSTRTVQVTVRGDAATIKKIKSSRDSGFYVMVDLSDYTQGAFTVPGRVVNGGNLPVSVAETVEIGVIISELPENGNNG